MFTLPPMHSRALAVRVQDHYSQAEVAAIEALLKARGALDFKPLPTGLFPASPVGRDSRYTGYEAVWVRDNVHVAHALRVAGAERDAGRCVAALGRWFGTQRARLDAAILRDAPPESRMQRPHIRFDGRAMREIAEDWNHGQNDAIGYLLWLYSRFARRGLVEAEPEVLEILGRLALYLEAVDYWRDEDSGHWEEDPKIGASSIGAALAGLEAFRELLEHSGPVTVNVGPDRVRLEAAVLDGPVERGRSALSQILPAECTQSEAGKQRHYDAALLFLIYPLGVVERPMARRIVARVLDHLAGSHGIRRYLGDTFWCADYHLLPKEIRTASVELRDAWFRDHDRPPPGIDAQAQWCLFDPLLSAIFGTWHQQTGEARWRELQIHHLNRALGQVVRVPSGELRCAELFYRREDVWVPNDVVPLLWTQANLSLALHQAQERQGQGNL